MGMFDYLRCEYPVPDPEHQNDRFQVRGLGHSMSSYVITADGRLLFHGVRHEEVPEGEPPYWGKPEWEHPILRMAGAWRSVEEWDEEVPFHGDLFLYSDGAEYVARFTDGRLQWIKREADAPVAGIPHPW